jgi:hypothetical protein
MMRRSIFTTLVSSALLIVSARCVAGKEANAGFGGLDGTWKFEYSYSRKEGSSRERPTRVQRHRQVVLNVRFQGSPDRWSGRHVGLEPKIQSN